MTGYQALFLKICTVFLIFGICLLFSFLIVFPLWLLATQYTPIYTAVSLAVFVLMLLFFIIKRNIKKYKRNAKKFFHSLLKKLIIITGLIVFLLLIFSYRRFSAFSALILAFVIYGFVAFGFSEERF